MGSIDTPTVELAHLVAMPYPGQGHINPMMDFCKRILSVTGDRLIITFVLTEEWLSYVIASSVSAQPPPNLRLATIPNVVPSERVRADEFPAFIEAVYTKMEEPFERLLDQLEPPAVSAIVADSYLPWAVTVGIRRNIPVASLFPMPASAFSMLYHCDLVFERHQFPLPVSEVGEEYVDCIPGVSRIRLADLPSIFHLDNVNLMCKVKETFTMAHKATWLLLNSCTELERAAVTAIRSAFYRAVHPVGPLIPSLSQLSPPSQDSTMMTTSFTTSYRSAVDCSAWLDKRPASSVLYVSLGSFLSVTAAQTIEIAHGLRASGCFFLWAVREQEFITSEHVGERGMVVRWCDQIKVLAHPAIGGFFSHCGWNSTCEGIAAGTPFLTFPILMDQQSNSKIIVEDWKIGLRVRHNVNDQELVGRERIAEAARELMDVDGESSKAMRKRAKELEQALCGSVQPGGSSYMGLHSFVGDLMAKPNHLT